MTTLIIAKNNKDGKYWAKQLKIKNPIIITQYKSLIGYNGVKYKYVGEYWELEDLFEIESYVSEHQFEEIV